MDLFGLDLSRRPDFSENYKNRKDCYGNKLPDWTINKDTEELLDYDSVYIAHQEAEKCLDDKVKNGMYLKERGYKLLTVLSTITLSLFGLMGYVSQQELTTEIKFLTIVVLILCIVWIFCIVYFLSEHLLKSVDYWSTGERVDNFVDKDLLSWCNAKKKRIHGEKERSFWLLCYNLNRIQDRIYFNESENRRRLGVINTVLCHIASFFIVFVFLMYLYVRLSF
ncbi:hypothetical protein [Phocaeicola barnesiae]